MAESGHYDINSITVRVQISAAGGEEGFIDEFLAAHAGRVHQETSLLG